MRPNGPSQIAQRFGAPGRIFLNLLSILSPWSSREPISHSLFVVALRPSASRCRYRNCDRAVTKLVDIRVLQSTNLELTARLESIGTNGSIVRWCWQVTERTATTKQRFALIACRPHISRALAEPSHDTFLNRDLCGRLHRVDLRRSVCL
jgi:hypothetical protein